jgi:hypothetical protein
MLWYVSNDFNSLLGIAIRPGYILGRMLYVLTGSAASKLVTNRVLFGNRFDQRGGSEALQ